MGSHRQERRRMFGNMRSRAFSGDFAMGEVQSRTTEVPPVLAGGPCGGSLPRAWLSGSKGDGGLEGRLHKQRSVYDGVFFFFLVGLCE